MAGSIIVGSLQTVEYKPRFITDKYSYGKKEAVDYNILHDYRSYNYVVTLAALSKEQYNDPTYFTKLNGDLDYTILKSSGKGKREIQADASTDVQVKAINEETGDEYTKRSANKDLNALLDSFNKNGYGRFDFFIENLEIDLTWNISNGAQPGQVKFEVVEPYSINGFIEALRINALAAGYENHYQAVYVLKIEFIGYRYDEKTGGLTEPTKIPKSTRYIPINLNQMSVETSERGTVYRCAAAPRNNMGFGEDGKLATNAKMKGSTVGEVLTALADQLTDARKKDTGEEEQNKNFYNEFKFVFQDEKGEVVDAGTSLIGKSKINDELRSNQVYSFPEVTDEDPKSSYQAPEKPVSRKYDSTKETVAFGSQHSILDVVTAVVRDSEYSKEMLGKLETVIKENNGLVNWFRVYLKSEIKPGINPKSLNHNYVYTFVIKPYKVHYSRLPGAAKGLFDGDDLRGQIRRSYNYLYSGKNIDIVNFNLKVNNLFVQQRPYKMGDTQAGYNSGSAPSKQVELKEGETPQDPKNVDQKPIATQVAVDANSLNKFGVQGKAAQSDPYVKLAQIMHEHLCDSTDLNTIDLQIVGDPYYLVSANMGNQEEDLDPTSPAQNKDGSAPWLGGTVFIDLYFQTIKDYKPDGSADFGDLLPFSGIYQVNRVICQFRDGKFEQRLNCLRLPGQIVNEKNQNIFTAPKEAPKAGEQSATDSAPSSVSKSGLRPNNAQLLNMLSRSLPTVGLPGVLANFTNAVGGALGGIGTELQTTLNRVSDSAQGILSPVNNLLQQAQSTLNFAAQVGGLVAVGNALVNGFDQPSATPGLGQTVGGYNPYTTGIRLDTNGLNDIAVGNSLSDQANINSQAKIISSFVQDGRNLDIINENYYNNVISKRIALQDKSINGTGQAVDVVTLATLNDPKAIAAQLGIDPAQLSGLSVDQQSSILSNMLGILNKIPENTSLAGLKALGVSLANLNGASIANLPALQPLTTAPIANISAFDLQKIIASGGNPANLPGAAGVPAVAALLALLNKEKSVPNNGLTGGQGQLNSQSLFDKYETAQAIGDQLQNNGGSVESRQANITEKVQGFGGYYVNEKTAFAQFGSQQTSSPIDKLMQTKI